MKHNNIILLNKKTPLQDYSYAEPDIEADVCNPSYLGSGCKYTEV
jgi:hypothetical protein